MKKTLLITSMIMGGVFGAAAASAASNVTLYGVVDMSVVADNVSSSVAGADTPTKVQMKSGFRNGSRWGIKGVEDLGSGAKVGFVLEQGFNADTGNASSKDRAFHRESQLFVAGDFGKVGFGRFGSLASGTGSYSMLGGWALGTSYTTGSFNNFDGTLRINNGIVYVSPNFGGVTLSAMYSNGTDVDDTNKWSENNHYYGLGATYKNGNLALDLIFEAQDHKYDKSLLDGEAKKLMKTMYQIDFGASYDFGAVTPMFAYRYQTQDNVGQAHTFGLSAKAPVAGGTVKAGVRYRLEKLDGALKDAAKAVGAEDDGSVWTINVAYEYPLSKRTTVWGYAGYADGSDLLGKKYINDINYNGWQAAVGMTHNF